MISHQMVQPRGGLQTGPLFVRGTLHSLERGMELHQYLPTSREDVIRIEAEHTLRKIPLRLRTRQWLGTL